jgi:hypothetical protein
MSTRRDLVFCLMFGSSLAIGCSNGLSSDRTSEIASPVDTLRLAEVAVPRKQLDLRFTTRRSIAWSDSAHMVVLDGDESQMVLLGLDGTERRIGRRGEGPGEFRTPITVTSLSDGGVAVVNLPATVIRFDRSLHPTARFTAPRSWPLTVLGAAGDTVTVFSQIVRPAMGRTISRVIEGTATEISSFRFDTIDAAFSIDPEIGEVPGTVAAQRPDGGFVVAQEDSYRLLWLDRHGRVERTGGREGLLLGPPPASEIERQITQIDSLERRNGDTRWADQERARIRRMATRPRAHLDRIAVDSAGWTWVLTTHGDPGTTIFDLFDQSGRYAATTSISGDTWAFAVRGGAVAVLQAAKEDDPEIDARIRVFRVASTAARP